MIDLSLDKLTYENLIVLVLVLALEYWLGGTNKIRANSTIALLINIVLFLKNKTKGLIMLEGKEFEQKLGEYGSASVDVTPELKVKVVVEAQVDLIAEAKKLAAKTQTPIDDQAIAWLEKIVGAAAALGK